MTRCRPIFIAIFSCGVFAIAPARLALAQDGWSPVPFDQSASESDAEESPKFGDDSRIAQLTQPENEPYVFQPSPTPDFGPTGPTGPPQAPPPYCYPEYPTLQLLPDGLMYKSYLAGPQEPRFASAWLYQNDQGWIWDATLGGRAGILRYGSRGAVRPQGWQLDIEGAAMTRLDVDNQEDLEAVNFRFGVPLTWQQGPWQMKFGYYHLSAHAGDEFLISHPTFKRVNYVRDSVIFGLGYFLTSDLRIYGEVANAFHHSVAEPWEFQFGFEYSPAVSTGLRGLPFFAANVQLFEEHDFGGALNTMAGWQWRGARSNRVFRLGLQYYNGKSSQFAFFDKNDELIGIGLWLDQ